MTTVRPGAGQRSTPSRSLFCRTTGVLLPLLLLRRAYLVRTWVVLTRQRDDSLSPPQPTIRTDQSQTSSWLIDCASAAAGLCWRDLRSSMISIASMHPRSNLADVRIPLLKSVQASPNGTTAHNDEYFRVMTHYGIRRLVPGLKEGKSATRSDGMSSSQPSRYVSSCWSSGVSALRAGPRRSGSSDRHLCRQRSHRAD